MRTQTPPETTSDFYLDITKDVCPITFVRTKLRLEKMQVGETLEVLLQGEEPLKNVPRSVKEAGHEIIACIPKTNGNDNIFYRLIIRKN